MDMLHLFSSEDAADVPVPDSDFSITIVMSCSLNSKASPVK